MAMKWAKGLREGKENTKTIIIFTVKNYLMEHM
jgi:hypothetical protein